MNCLFPISYILDPMEDDKNLYHDLICSYCLEDAKSAPSSELSEPAEHGRESYFSKHKGMKSPCFQENILFMVPNTLDLNLYECQDLIFFIIHTFKNIFIHLSAPDSECSVDKTISLYPYSFKCIKQSHYVHDESGTTPSALQIL